MYSIGYDTNNCIEPKKEHQDAPIQIKEAPGGKEGDAGHQSRPQRKEQGKSREIIKAKATRKCGFGFYRLLLSHTYFPLPFLKKDFDSLTFCPLLRLF